MFCISKEQLSEDFIISKAKSKPSLATIFKYMFYIKWQVQNLFIFLSL